MGKELSVVGTLHVTHETKLLSLFRKKSLIVVFIQIMVLSFIFEDDIHLAEPDCKVVDFFLVDNFEVPRIFNFPSIHLYLNTGKIERLKSVKQL